MGRKKRLLSELVQKESIACERRHARQKNYMLDLRIHSPASLGYLGIEGLDTAPALVRLAKVKGLDVIAVTDYFSGGFVDKVMEAARESTLTVLPGVTLRCTVSGCNDVILCCLFSERTNSSQIEEFLFQIGVPPYAFGDRRYTLSTPLGEILKVVEKMEGAALPSRMDKTPYRLAAIPALVEQFGFRAFDLAYPDTAHLFRQNWPKLKFQLFSFSNANALAQVGSRIARVKMASPGFEGVRRLVARDYSAQSVPSAPK